MSIIQYRMKGLSPMNSFLKKIVSGCVVLALAMSVSVSAFADTFKDMPNDWRTEALENAVKNGLLSGFEDGTIGADSAVTRAQMAAIIVRALGAKEAADLSSFVDVSPNKWYYNEFAKAVYMNAFSGDTDKKLNPNSPITFQECFTVLSRVFGLSNRIDTEEAEKLLASYPDGSEVSGWARVYYASLLQDGYWDGGMTKLLKPKEYINRGEFAVVMDNLVKTYITEPGEYTELPEGNVLVRCDGVILDGLTFDSDVIIADAVSVDGVSLKDVVLNKRLVMRGCASPCVVEYETADGGIGTETTYTKNACSLSGAVYDVQVIAPYISINLSQVKFAKAHCEKGSRIHFGSIG